MLNCTLNAELQLHSKPLFSPQLVALLSKRHVFIKS